MTDTKVNNANSKVPAGRTTPSPLKITSVKDLLNQAINGQDYEVKMKSKRELAERFDVTKDHTQISQQLKSIDYDPIKMRNLSMALTNVATHVEQLKSNPTSELVDQIATKEEVSIPKAAKDKKKYLLSELEKKRKEITGSSNKLRALKTQIETLNKEHAGLLSKFIADEKGDYNSWAKNLLEEHAGTYGPLPKKSNVVPQFDDKFDMLESHLATAPPQKQDLYRTKIAYERADANCARLSRAGTIAKYLADEALNQYLSRSVAAMHRRKDLELSQVDRSSYELTDANYELIPEDLANADMSKSAFEFLFDTELMRQLRSETVSPKNSAAFQSLATMGRESPLYSSVVSYISGKKYQYEDEMFPELITGLVADFISRLGRCLKTILDIRGSISTIKVGIFHSLLEPQFIMRGDDYSVVSQAIEELWDIKSAKN
ncbi:MAG: hypothetical protein CMM93_01755 [Rickettsiales bacterium]|nr:hypothetical protein [Rickettsiales bacterium]|tara:strand:+ start:2507 stop:3805 length:1299 start_codon:yes stop_codon:yes gene_type:complete